MVACFSVSQETTADIFECFLGCYFYLIQNRIKSFTFVSFLICEPTKIPSFIIASLEQRNFCCRYRKARPSFCIALTKLFTKLSFIWSGNKNTFTASTKASWILFISPGCQFLAFFPVFHWVVLVLGSAIPFASTAAVLHVSKLHGWQDGYNFQVTTYVPTVLVVVNFVK